MFISIVIVARANYKCNFPRRSFDILRERGSKGGSKVEENCVDIFEWQLTPHNVSGRKSRV